MLPLFYNGMVPASLGASRVKSFSAVVVTHCLRMMALMEAVLMS